MMKTCCPQCETVLTLNQQQVEQRNGMVRCGVCRQVFNALEHLYQEEDDYPVLNEDSEPAIQLEPVRVERPSMRHPALDRTQSIVRPIEREPSYDAFGDGVQRPTVHIHVNQAAATPAVSAPTTVSAVTPTHERGEHRIVMDTAAQDDNDDYYIGHANTRVSRDMSIDSRDDDFRIQGDNAYEGEYEPVRRRSSGLGLFWFVLILLAILLIVGQVFYVFRNQIASAFPASRPLLTQMCAVFKCEVGIQKSVDNLALENVLISVDKTKLPKRGEHALLLQAVLVNKVEQAQEWPVLILRLKNKDGAVMNSKNIEPKEYLAAEQAMQPFPAQSRQAINLPFMLQGDAISSYELSIFYP